MASNDINEDTLFSLNQQVPEDSYVILIIISDFSIRPRAIAPFGEVRRVGEKNNISEKKLTLARRASFVVIFFFTRATSPKTMDYS